MTVEIIEMAGENVLKLGEVDNEVKDSAVGSSAWTIFEALRTLDPFRPAGLAEQSLPIRLHSLFNHRQLLPQHHHSSSHWSSTAFSWDVNAVWTWVCLA